MNSIKFNEVDWTIVVKKVKPEVAVIDDNAAEETSKKISEE